MTKIHTLGQLQTTLDSEFAWRVKEILNLKLAVQHNKSLSEKTLIRAGVTLLYAHWEGFVKAAAQAYLDFVNTQGHKYEDLATCFVALGMRKHLSDLGITKKTALHVAALNFMRTAMGTRAQMKSKSMIDAESNLNSEVFANIATSIGIDTSAYESSYNLIDERLLAQRNKMLTANI